MQQIFDIIAAFFGLTRAAINRVENSIDLDPLRSIHAKYLGRIVFLMIALLFVMIGLNYVGLEKVNIFISLVLLVPVLLIGLRPEFLIAAATAGAVEAIIDGHSIRRSIEWFFCHYFRAICDVILWVSIFGMFLGTISCRNNPGAILTIAVALVVIGYGSRRWNLGPAMYKRVIYGYAVIIFLTSLLSLVPTHTWIHWIGYDVTGVISSSETEKDLSDIEKSIQSAETEKNAEMFKAIREKVEKKIPLSEQDQKFLRIMREERESRSLVNKLSSVVSELSLPSFTKTADTASVTPTPAPQQPQVVMVSITTPAVPAITTSGVDISRMWDMDIERKGRVTFKIDQFDECLRMTRLGSADHIEATKTAEGVYSGRWYQGSADGPITIRISSDKKITGTMSTTSGTYQFHMSPV